MRPTLVAFATLLVAWGGIVAAQVGTPAPAAPPAVAADGPVGNPENGKAVFAFGNTSCSNCHGRDGEGAFAPALAGRGLTYKRFHDYVRSPLGRMPAYIESELTDQEIADMVAYFAAMPKPEKPSAWRTPAPTTPMPRGQQLAVQTIGCGQCHGLTLETPRHGAAEVSGDFEWFKHMVYEHTTAQREQWAMLDKTLRPVTPQPAGPPGRNRIRMGNYSRTRLTEANLKEIWDWVNTLGPHLPPLNGQVTAANDGPNVTYTVNVANSGVKDKGVTAEDVMVTLALPMGAKVVKTTGVGYEGPKANEELKSEAVTFRVPKMAATERQTFTVTVAGAAAGGPLPKGVIRWAKPAVNEEDAFVAIAGGGRGRG